MAEIVYALCAVMSVACATCLFRGYRKTQTQLLLWSSLCFGIFALNNCLLFVDLVIFPDVEFNGLFWRNLLAASAGFSLLYGLIGEMT